MGSHLPNLKKNLNPQEQRSDMPLIKGHSRSSIGFNINEMEKAGHPYKQAVAAALDTARRSYMKLHGGSLPKGLRKKK